MNFCSFLTTFIIVFAAIVKAEEKLGLYDKTDDVAILNDANFAAKVYNADRAWVIEFYNTWCGHCVKFAPKWKQFAMELRGIMFLLTSFGTHHPIKTILIP